MTSTTSRHVPPQPGPAAEDSQPRFLEDKLQIPQSSLPVLRRRRLTELIEQASGHRVTLVSGPAGAGKTVACASWAASTPASRPVAWLTLDSQDTEPERFWAYVRAGLARARTVPAEAVRSLEGASPDAFPLVLVQAAQLFTEPVILVLDDVHEVAGGAVVPGLDMLIRHAPPSLRLILSGRSPPGLQLARLRVSGELAEVRASDLACTPAEVDAYFAMLGLQIDAGERDELLTRTEGWMAGLRLAAMRGRAHRGEQGWIAGIAGDEPTVTDYLADEVLGRLPNQTRLFLLRTSVAENVSGNLADALTGEPGGARTLDLLSRENSFVETLDHDRAEFRYHPLLRGVLLAELRRKLPQEIPVLLRRAARWHAEHGEVIDALRCSAEAGDWDYGAYVLADAGPAALMSSGAAGLEAVLALFPAERRADDAAIAAACAAARLWSGDPEGAAAHLDDAQHGLGRLAEQMRRVIEPGLAAMRVMQAASRADADPGLLARGESLAERAQAAASTSAEHRAIGFLWFALGIARLRRWEIRQARQALAFADRQLAAGDLAGLQSRARGWRSLAEAWHGDLAEAEKAASDAGDSTADGPGGASWLAALARAQVSLVRDELGAARRLLAQAQECAPSQFPGEPQVSVLLALTSARILLADGDAIAARSVMLRLRETRSCLNGALDQVMTVLDGEIALRAGTPAAPGLSSGWPTTRSRSTAPMSASCTAGCCCPRAASRTRWRPSGPCWTGVRTG